MTSRTTKLGTSLYLWLKFQLHLLGLGGIARFYCVYFDEHASRKMPNTNPMCPVGKAQDERLVEACVTIGYYGARSTIVLVISRYVDKYT